MFVLISSLVNQCSALLGEEKKARLSSVSELSPCHCLVPFELATAAATSRTCSCLGTMNIQASGLHLVSG